MALNGKYTGKKDDDGGIWLHNGFKEFATHYTLSHGHLILFKYHKTPHLEVRIFDKSTLEINYPLRDTRNENEHEDLEEVTPSPQPRKRSRTRSSRVVVQRSDLPLHADIKVEQLQEDKSGATKSVKLEQVISNVAGTSRSEASSFTIVMKDSYLYGYSLVIPINFVKEYLKKKPRDFLLRVLDGRTWTLSYRNGRFTGWNKFASDSHLNVGDVCVFELIKSRDYYFKVTIIRLSEETRSPDLSCATGISIKAMREARKFTPEHPFFTVNIMANGDDFRTARLSYC